MDEAHYLNGANHCFENGKRLYKSAHRLFRQKDLPSACFLAFTAIEELAKSMTCFLCYKNNISSQTLDEVGIFHTHQSKLVFLQALQAGLETNVGETAKFGNTELTVSEWKKRARQLKDDLDKRHACLYVDHDFTKSEWHIPKDQASVDYFNQLHMRYIELEFPS